MKINKVNINELKMNPNNPRVVKDDKFRKLVKSIQEFPKMLEIRPIVVNNDMIVLGGNMRLKASKEAGLKEVFIIKAEDLTDEEQRQFIIKDNVGYGDWDWTLLRQEWDEAELNEWGMDIPNFEDDNIDYGILDEEDLEEELKGIAGNIRKAIQIEFEPEHYDEANELVRFWREQKLYIGGFLMEKLNEEKNKL